MNLASRLRELYAYRELVLNLTIRDVKLKYKRSFLGVAWSLLNPLFMMAIYTVVFSLFLRVVRLPNYWALVLGGLLVWTFLASAITSATSSFVAGGGLISKLYFPVESLSIANVMAQFVNFAVSMAIFLVALVIAGIPLGPSLILLPVIIIATLGLALGVGLLLASLTVYFRDLEHLVTLALAALFYLTPVIYPLDTRVLPASGAKFVTILKLNPLTWFLESYHSVLYYGTWPDPVMFTLMLLAAVIALLAGYTVFARLRPRLAEEL
ncbi:MAG: ABC transporter permease [Candidatus Dormibacteraceae bacterium]